MKESNPGEPSPWLSEHLMQLYVSSGLALKLATLSLALNVIGLCLIFYLFMRS